MTRHRCTPSERLFCLTNDHRQGEGTVNGAIRCRGRLDPDRLRDALLRLQNRHAKLRSCIEYDKEDWSWFVEMDPAPPISCEFRDIDDAAEAFDIHVQGLTDRFPSENQPLVKLLVLSCPQTDTTDIVGWFHHVAFDGRAVWMFYRELRELYGNPDAHHPPAPDGFGVSPAGRQGFFGDLGWLGRLFWGRMVLDPFLKTVSFRERPASAVTYTRLFLSEEQTSRLRDACSRAGASVSGALSAAACLAIAGELDSQGQLIAIPTPRDVRTELSPRIEDGTLGCFVTTYEVLLPLPSPQDDFWTVARHHADEARRQFEWKDPVRGLRLVKWIPWKVLVWKGTTRGALVINNFGHLPLPPAPGLPDVTDFYAYGRSSSFGTSLFLTATTTNDRMSFILSSGCFSLDELNGLLRKLEATLDEAVEKILPVSSIPA